MKTICALAALLLAGCGGSSPAPVTAPSLPAVTTAPASVPSPVSSDYPIVLMGDSITQNWKLIYGLPDPTIIDEGIHGNTTVQMHDRFQADVLALHPRVVVILGGTNDISINEGDDRYSYPSAIFEMVEEAEAAGVKVIVGTVPPALFDKAKQQIPVWNAVIRNSAKAYGYTVVDYHATFVNADGTQNLSLFNTDGTHPNAAGYKLMWPLLEAALEKADGY
jgi:lysophospholipase L1-like esterase